MATHWHEDDAFWIAMKDFLFDEGKSTAARTQVDWIAQTLALQPGARVLDLPCGTGRHAIAMAQRGMDVTGVDRMAMYLDEARRAERRAREAEPGAPWGAPIAWQAGDMRTFAASPELHAHFDAALNLWTSLGYFDSWEENAEVLRSFRRSLKPGGHLVIEVAGREVLARVFQPRRWSELPDGRILLESVQVIDDWSRMRTRWIVIRNDGTRVERIMTLWLYSARDLRDLLTACGFDDIRIFGSLDGSAYDHTAKRLVVLARAAPGAPAIPGTRP